MNSADDCILGLMNLYRGTIKSYATCEGESREHTLARRLNLAIRDPEHSKYLLFSDTPNVVSRMNTPRNAVDVIKSADSLGWTCDDGPNGSFIQLPMNAKHLPEVPATNIWVDCDEDGPHMPLLTWQSCVLPLLKESGSRLMFLMPPSRAERLIAKQMERMGLSKEEEVGVE